jgi:Uncharacterized conserved protein
MCPKVTQNGSSLQIILPKSICESTSIKAGDTLNLMTDGETISLVKPKGYIRSEPNALPNVFTIGYESRTLDSFIERLKTYGIKQLIDVREKPISRKKGFSKNALRQRLEEEDIRYVHIPAFGSPSDIRKEYKDGGSEKTFFNRYQDYLDTELEGEMGILDEYVSSMESALMCFELSYVHCHRKVIAKELSNLGHSVVHI